MPQHQSPLSNAPRPRQREAVLELQRLLEKHPDTCRYSLVVIDEHGRASLQHYSRPVDWARAAADYLGRDVIVFPFVGTHVPFSETPPPPAPQFRYLLLPGNPIPLFTMPTELAPAGGDLGQQYAQLTRVNSLQGDAVPEPTPAEEAAEPAPQAPPVDDAGPSVF